MTQKKMDGVQADRKASTRHRPVTLRKREEILKAALDVFGRKGAAKGTLEEIADQVGMTRAGILHHFGSKRRLLIEVLKYNDAEEVADLPDRKMPQGGAGFDHLLGTIAQHARNPEIARSFITLSSESITEGNPGHPFFRNRYANLRGEVADWLVEMAREKGKELDRDHALMVSSSILAVMDGLQLQWLMDEGEEGQIDMVRTLSFTMHILVSAVLNGSPADCPDGEGGWG
ncbi:TetR/AcrR family transcriptional regulator [Bifidobacterium favimelis]|uniref:TetR/AcrR family transcriptional regulator n=1 Tax=Bifidobacterium favimelis TaxID=3122979 RepID=A0ABU8ZNU4_9BIFI